MLVPRPPWRGATMAVIVPRSNGMDAKARFGSRAEIQARLDRVNDEIKAYPQPIARCDAQLAGLLEEREGLRRALEGLARDG